ncbi:MAG: Oligopeptide transport ATP-binding protein OppD [Candidatus Phytoplasma pruni]
MSLLKVNNLHTYFQTQKGFIKAVEGVSFELEEGRTLGIIGESGSGKSQTAMSILQLFEPNQKIYQGEIVFNKQVISKFDAQEMQKIRGKEIAMIFQDPMASLNPVFKIKHQIMDVLMLHRKMNKKEAYNKALEMLDKVKIKNPQMIMESYPYQLSGGMCQRVMISIALVCEPKILIADEATTALDVIVQKEILNLMNELKKEQKISILFITHDLGVVSQMADNIIVMYGGKVVEKGSTKAILHNPQHPYTKSLLANFKKTGI